MNKVKSFKLKNGTWFNNGDTFAEYYIESVLGIGYEGEAYAVTEGYSDGLRVLKIFRDIQEDDFIDYTYRMEMLSQVSSNFLQFYHGGCCWKGNYFMILERAIGNDLSHYKNKLSIFESLNITKQLLQCLVEAHNIAMCVGELYPENIVYDKSSQKLKVIDFDYEADYSQKEYIQEDITAVCQLLYYLCENVPPELQRIVSVDNDDRYSASEILENLRKLY